MNPPFNTSGYVLKDGELRLLQKGSWAVVRLSEIVKVKKPTLTSAVIRLADGRRRTLDLSHLRTAAFAEVNGTLEAAARHHRIASSKLTAQSGYDPLIGKLKAAFRALDALPLKTKEDLVHWHEAADAFREKLNSEWESLSTVLPHELEHYLDDVDIRAKDPGYADHQRKRLAVLLTPPAAPINASILDERTPVWSAMSELFLDTELQEQDHQRIAQVLAVSPYSIDKLDEILRFEVTPELKFNLISIAGEWAGFNEAWLRERLASRVDARPLGKPSVVWMMRRRWKHIRELVAKISAEAKNKPSLS